MKPKVFSAMIGFAFLIAILFAGISDARVVSGIPLWENEPFLWNREIPRPSKPVVVTYWRAFDDRYEAALNQLAEEFMKLFPEITIKFQGMPVAEEVPQKVAIAAATGAEPLIVGAAGNFFMVQYVYAGLAKDMRAYVNPDYISDLMAPQLYRYKEGFYGFPHEFNHCNLCYNKDLLDESGVFVPQNWQELRDALKKLTRMRGGKIAQYGMAGVIWANEAGYHHQIPAFWSAGAEDIDPTGRKCLMDSPEYQKVLEFYDTLLNVDRSMVVLGGDYNFEKANVGMFMCGQWTFPYWDKEYRLNFDITQFPGPRGEKAPGSIGGYFPLVTKRFDRVDKDTQNATLLWLAFLSSDHPIEIMFDKLGTMPARKSAAARILTRKNLHPAIRSSVRIALEGGVRARFAHPKTVELLTTITATWTDALLNRVPIRNAILNGARKVQAILDSVRQ